MATPETSVMALLGVPGVPRNRMPRSLARWFAIAGTTFDRDETKSTVNGTRCDESKQASRNDPGSVHAGQRRGGDGAGRCALGGRDRAAAGRPWV